MRSRFTRATIASACALALLAAPATGLAKDADVDARGDGVTITQVDSSQWPTMRVAFGADNDKGGDTPTLTFFENGEAIDGATMFRGKLGSFDEKRRTDLMLVVDTSLSMGNGTRFDDARAAAQALLEHARKDDMIGLATFGGTAEVLVKPTTDHGQIAAALAALQLRNRTTMFDAVTLAAKAFDEDAKANRAIVLHSDGTDVGSSKTVEDATGAATRLRAPIFAVAISEDPDAQPKDLSSLGNGTGGELRAITDTSELDELFDDLG
ncbi:MAG: hypothetical protein JWM86_516, partial [Thermoleophilia bacterium]|nr:hypothetical protein [Thermoleophilia bacterium]